MPWAIGDLEGMGGGRETRKFTHRIWAPSSFQSKFILYRVGICSQTNKWNPHLHRSLLVWVEMDLRPGKHSSSFSNRIMKIENRLKHVSVRSEQYM